MPSSRSLRRLSGAFQSIGGFDGIENQADGNSLPYYDNRCSPYRKFGATITDEFELLRINLGLSNEDLVNLTVNAVEASFLSESAKRILMDEIR